MSIIASNLTNGPRKHDGGGSIDKRLATEGGGGNAPPEIKK